MAEAFTPFLTKKQFINNKIDPFSTVIPQRGNIDVSKFSPSQVVLDQLKQRQMEPVSQDEINNAIQNSVFGSAGSDMSQVDVGAFKDIPKAPSIINQAEEKSKVIDKTTTTKLDPVTYAKQIADSLYDNQTGSEPDWGVASLLYFSKMAELASQPGATALGAAGAAGTAPAAYLMQKEKEKAAREDKKSATVAALVPSIIKAQTPKKSFTTLSQDKAEALGYDTKNGEIAFQISSEGEVKQVTKAPFMAEQKEITGWLKNTTNTNTGLYKEDVKGSRKAKAAAGQYDEILNYLDNPEFETNWKAGKLQGIKEMLGGLGILDEKELDQVQNAQAFRAKTYSLVLASVAQMKGALSDRELVFLQQQTVSLSNSKVANQLIALSTKKLLDQASRFDDFQYSWQKNNLKGDDGKWRTIQNNAEYLEMMAQWRQLPENKENIYQYVTRLSSDYRNELLNQYKGEVNEDNEIIPGTLIDPVNPNFKIEAGSTREKEIVGQINNQVNQRFATKAHEKIFGKKFRLDEKSVFDTRSEKT
jgi:hypothetical protein|tara:strand:+ start:310 stop:1902 length:1593 start_codon:yes stop_codon:yes gene_type:complete